MNIIELDLNNSIQKKDFINFPFHLYKHNAYWVPPIQSELRTVLNPQKHPFYRHSEARFFLAKESSQIVGRLAAIINKNYAQFHNESIGFFYYFDSINNQMVTKGLFDQAIKWFKQSGCKKIIGPKGFLRSNGFGILVKGFNFLPAVGIPYNFPYYDNLLSEYGFKKLTDHMSGYLYAKNPLPEKLHKIADKVRERNGFWVKSFKNKKEMKPWIPLIDKVHFKAFQNNPNFFPSTKQEFEMMAKNILLIANPEMIKIIMKGNEIAGFVISYPNISKALQKSKGKLFPLGWLHVLKEQHFFSRIDINGVGLLPDFQGRGANALLYSELEKTLRRTKAPVAELIQIDERNFLSKSDMEMLGVDWQKIHRTYELEI